MTSRACGVCRYTEIETAGTKIHALLKQNLELFQADESGDIWKAYVDYVDEMIVDGFFNTIHCGIQFLMSNTELQQIHALFEAKLELHVSRRPQQRRVSGEGGLVRDGWLRGGIGSDQNIVLSGAELAKER